MTTRRRHRSLGTFCKCRRKTTTPFSVASDSSSSSSSSSSGGEETKYSLRDEKETKERTISATTTKNMKTGVLNRVPNVAQSKDILLSGLKRSSRITHTSQLRVPLLKERNKSAKQLDGLTTALCKPLGEYVKGFPKIDRLHPFEKALLELTVDPETYAKTIARWTRRGNRC